MKEVDLNKKVVDWICTFGNAYKRASTPARAGEPDVTGCAFGIRIELEGKMPGKKPTKLQAKRLKTWKQSGAITGYYTSLEEAKKIVINGLTDYFLSNQKKIFEKWKNIHSENGTSLIE